EFAQSMLDDTADTRYRGYSPLAKLWLAAGTFSPLARDINSGIAGLSNVDALAGLAVLDDPDLKSASKRVAKWRDANTPEDEDDFGKPNEFNTYMRSFELKLREPGALQSLDAREVAHKILEGMPPGHDRSDVAASLRARKKLAFVSKLKPEQKASV